MKAIQLASFGIFPMALFIAACGDDVTKVTKIEETSGLEVVASADSLGTCTAELSGEMKFATKENAVYVCADSAWKNISEAKKTACSAEALSDSSGFKIVCDGDSVGVVKNGEDGKKGAEGDAGKDGANGEGCKLVDGPIREAGSSLVQTSFVVCGGDTVGTISDGRPGENCELADNGDGTVKVVCGETSTTLYKALCGGKAYNPDSNFCAADSLVPLCGGESYRLNENFCFADSIVSLCGGKMYDLDSSFCLDGKVYKNKTLVWSLMNPEIEYGVFVDDRDDQVYRSVKIGKQTWMAENLNYETDESSCYNNDSANCEYGRIYSWDAAMKACPEGWHLPDSSEFATLFVTGGAQKCTATEIDGEYGCGWYHSLNQLISKAWKWPDSDDFGFSAYPTPIDNDYIWLWMSKLTIVYPDRNYYVNVRFVDITDRLEAAYDVSFSYDPAYASVRCVKD